jgi:hypothetical protein
MQVLGGSIVEAIDWVQDKLATTRPLAERTLFSLITGNKVQETEQGFMLFEADDEVRNHHTQVNRAARPHGKRGRGRKRARQRRSSKMQHMKKQTDSVEVVSEEAKALETVSDIIQSYLEGDHHAIS